MKKELETLLSKALNLIEGEEERLDDATDGMRITITHLKKNGSPAKGTVEDLIAELRDAEEQRDAYQKLGEAIEEALDW